jgi:hypothetical protein
LSLAASDQAAIIGAGAAAVLVLSGGIFKAANLRGDTNNKWSSRIDLAAIALDEKAAIALQKLRDDIDDLMPDDPFEPGRAIVDPSPLSERVEMTGKYYRARVRMEKDLTLVLRLGRFFVVALTALVLAVVMLTLYFAQLCDWWEIHWAGFVLGGVAVAIIVGAGASYVFCVDRLSSSEILAESASQVPTGAEAA